MWLFDSEELILEIALLAIGAPGTILIAEIRKYELDLYGWRLTSRLENRQAVGMVNDLERRIDSCGHGFPPPDVLGLIENMRTNRLRPRSDK